MPIAWASHAACAEPGLPWDMNHTVLMNLLITAHNISICTYIVCRYGTIDAEVRGVRAYQRCWTKCRLWVRLDADRDASILRDADGHRRNCHRRGTDCSSVYIPVLVGAGSLRA
jgi:hypothetical protein